MNEEEKLYLVCYGCDGEVFDTIETARAHELTSNNLQFAHEYTIQTESEAM